MSTNVTSLKTALSCESLQEVFDVVTERLLRQGRACVDGSGCTYDNEKGQRCAVGLIMNDAELEFAKLNDLNGNSANTLSRNLGYFSGDNLNPIQQGDSKITNLNLLLALQDVHDNNQQSDVDRWRSNVAQGLRHDVARRFDLNTNRIDEVMHEFAA